MTNNTSDAIPWMVIGGKTFQVNVISAMCHSVCLFILISFGNGRFTFIKEKSEKLEQNSSNLHTIFKLIFCFQFFLSDDVIL